MSFFKLTNIVFSSIGKTWTGIKLFGLPSGRWLGRWLVAGAILVPLALVWYNPFLMSYAVMLTVLIWLVTLWQQWSGWGRAVSWMVAGLVLACYWFSTFLWWLFLDNFWYRGIVLALTAFFSWWYLREWQRLRLTLFLGEAGAGATPTLVLSFISCFALGVSAQNFLVFLNISLWQLLLAFYLPMAVLVICFCYASGWSVIKKMSYWFTGLAVLLQVFILTTWWPTSFYVVGFSLAVTFALVALVIRQEAQGFISRRSFIRELSLATGMLILVLISARWY